MSSLGWSIRKLILRWRLVFTMGNSDNDKYRRGLIRLELCSRSERTIERFLFKEFPLDKGSDGLGAIPGAKCPKCGVEDKKGSSQANSMLSWTCFSCGHVVSEKKGYDDRFVKWPYPRDPGSRFHVKIFLICPSCNKFLLGNKSQISYEGNQIIWTCPKCGHKY
jgi:Zn ribbon nucleic-acid-binding protein